MRKPRLFSYTGPLEVNDDKFELEAKRLILLKDGVKFHLSGKDEHGDFSVQGSASKKPEGVFFSPSVAVTYSQYSGAKLFALIEFTALSQTPKKTKCKVKGVWQLHGFSLRLFSGTLRQFKIGR